MSRLPYPLHYLSLLLLVSIAALTMGTPFDAPAVDAPPAGIAMAEAFDSGTTVGLRLVPCLKMNSSGCEFVSYSCSMETCCCVFTCAPSQCEPNDGSFPLAPDWAG